MYDEWPPLWGGLFVQGLEYALGVFLLPLISRNLPILSGVGIVRPSCEALFIVVLEFKASEWLCRDAASFLSKVLLKTFA